MGFFDGGWYLLVVVGLIGKLCDGVVSFCLLFCSFVGFMGGRRTRWCNDGFRRKIEKDDDDVSCLDDDDTIVRTASAARRSFIVTCV